MSIGGIASVLVGVADAGAALALFRDTMGLTVESDAVASAERLAFWRLNPATRIRLIELSCDGYAAGRLVLASYDPVPSAHVRVHQGDGPHDGPADIGPKAIDFYVRPPIRPLYDTVRAAGFTARSEPILHEVGGAVSEEFVFWGPGGTPLLLMVGHRHTEAQMRGGYTARGFSEVATISVVGADVEESRRFYGDVLGLELIQDDRTEPEFLDRANELTGTPRGTPIHWLLYRGAGEPSGKILVLHFIGHTGKRLEGRMRPGRLGFSLLSHRTGAFDDMLMRLRTIGALRGDAQVDGRRAMLALGPNEEFFEIEEA